MALLQDELKITKLHDLLGMKLALPSYQRPYTWSVKSTNTLFLDTLMHITKVYKSTELVLSFYIRKMTDITLWMANSG
jgi:uncharacterized protein with ParB-like and HNH nuclease domain